MKYRIWNLVSRILNWVKNNPVEFWILLAILVVAAFLRLYRISDYMTFLGDEGRDVIIVRRFITELHPPLIGPGTSVGNMYLGPLYYYMMAPALLIANFSPVGPAVQIAILGVITVFFVWFIFREWFPQSEKHIAWGALISAGLYAISPTVIEFSRSSWNPNIMPFFAILSIYSIWKIWKDHKFGWLIILGISYAFVLQSHYLGFLLAPTLFVFWFLTFRNLKTLAIKSLEIRNFLKKSLFGLLIFAGLMSPLLFFDLRHNWQNFDAFKIFLTSNKDIGLSFSDYLSKLGNVAAMLFANLLAGKNTYLGILSLAISVIFLIWIYKKRFFTGAYGLLALWIAVGLFGISYYRGQIYDHYLGFLFPAPFILFGVFAQSIFKSKNFISKILLSVVIISIAFFSFKNDPPAVNPTYQLPRAISVARVIQEKANGQRFNLATISDLSNRDVYQYFLVIWGAKVVDTDPSSINFTVTDQLFVVCEFPIEKCDPIHNPSAWITNFGWTKITDEWPVWGGTLFKLGHTAVLK